MTPQNRILICATCQRAADVGAEQALVVGALKRAGLGDEFTVQRVDCLGGCEAPVSVAFQGPGRASYVFSGVSVGDDVADILAVCRAYLAAPAGWIVDARPLGRLRHCLRARVPAMDQPAKG